jgi:precorrin-2/cobalt-factor-2 C20-methyltransferase
MKPDRTAALQAYDDTASAITEVLEQGKSAAFITLGDPGIYSTWLYIQRRVRALGYETVTIPGVPSFCAAAARLGTGLCEDDEALLILPASAPEELTDIPVNKVLMKRVSVLPNLAERLERRGAALAAVSNCGLPGERVYHGANELKSVRDYFTLVIVKERGRDWRLNSGKL